MNDGTNPKQQKRSAVQSDHRTESVREGDTVSTIRPLKINKLQSSSFALCYRDVSQSELNCARRSRMDFIVNLAPRNFRDLFHSELAWLAKAIR